MSAVHPVPRIAAEPLTAAGFAPFGELVTSPERPGRRRADRLVEFASDRSMVLSTTHAECSEPPVTVTELERHPHSSQTFLPLEVSRWLLIVTASPAVGDVRAFVAGPGVGVTIGRGVWHHGLVVLDAPGHFAVLMGKDDATDTEVTEVQSFEVVPDS